MHSFDPVDAEKYGILEAILLSNIRWWTAKNEANGKHYFDGRYWTYNSAKAFAKLFPYASQQQIQRALKSLEKAKMIVVGNYNSNPYDHTKWFAIDDYFDRSDLINHEVSFDQPSNTYINTVVNSREASSQSFDTFWSAYPRKTNKSFAKRVFDKMAVDQPLLSKILESIEVQKKTVWKDKDQQYIPHPSTWLNGQRWEDEILTTAKPVSLAQRAGNIAAGRPADYCLPTPEEQAEREKARLFR
jgi:hypothetical protein